MSDGATKTMFDFRFQIGEKVLIEKHFRKWEIREEWVVVGRAYYDSARLAKPKIDYWLERGVDALFMQEALLLSASPHMAPAAPAEGEDNA